MLVFISCIQVGCSRSGHGCSVSIVGPDVCSYEVFYGRYDVQMDQWLSCPSGTVFSSSTNEALLSYNGYLYVCGQDSYEDPVMVERYSPSTQTWEVCKNNKNWPGGQRYIIMCH